MWLTAQGIVWWPRMEEDIKNVVLICSIYKCMLNKPKAKNYQPYPQRKQPLKRNIWIMLNGRGLNS